MSSTDPDVTTTTNNGAACIVPSVLTRTPTPLCDEARQKTLLPAKINFDTSERKVALPLHLAKAVRCGPLGLAAEPLGVRSVSD